mmetsp:Transcript_102950/g.290805  ORF Transcript_102950/g.290805 Transcript_102950/m.290805 type:complete len:219 (+) Transcript_102950:5101-5757(+)
MRVSPTTLWAAFTAFSVSSTPCLTSTMSSPPAAIISAVMTAFSTASSAALVLRVHSGSISSRMAESLSSRCLFFCSFSSWVRVVRTFCNSLLMVWDVILSWFAICANLGPVWAVAVRCASVSFRCASVSGFTVGARKSSACLRATGLRISPIACRACCKACWPAPCAAWASPPTDWMARSDSRRCCSSFVCTTSVGRGAPSHGIFQPLVGGNKPLLLQ